MAKKKSVRKPNINPTPPSPPPPPRTTLATPEQLAEIHDLGAASRDLAADLKAFVRFAEAAGAWARLYQETGAHPTRLAGFDTEEGRRAQGIRQTIQETYIAAARFLQRLGIDERRLLQWANAQQAEDYSGMHTDVTAAIVRHQLTCEKLDRRLEDAVTRFEAEAAPQSPADPTQAASNTIPPPQPPGPPPAPAFRLNSTHKKILALVRRKRMKGETIAVEIDRTYEHTRSLLAKLVNEGYLENTEEGYKTIKTG
jgi:hypothetical protein